ncbi:MAG: helix-turn-helix domain-containing protein [Acutalibacteraceae bacterium]|jgi:DNA-binding transcriptional regulator YiaG
MDAKEIGRTISTHRKALGLTQMQLAAQLQVSNRTVSKWENGVSHS